MVRHELFASESSRLYFAEEFDGRRAGEEAGFGAARYQFLYGFLAFFAIAERPVVDVHADKFIGELGVHFARELHGVVQGFLAVLQAVGNAVPDGLRDLTADLRAQRTSHGIASERKRQACFFLPPDAEIYDAVQP